MSDQPLSHIKHIVLVLSGKGGVGKSSVTTQTALTLVSQGFKVGVLDIDLTGPSLPRMFGLEDQKVLQGSSGWIPVKYGNADLYLMSLGFLLKDRGNSVVWRGPKKTAMIRQFIKDVRWEFDLDYLLIDTPPGTSDEHIAIAEELRPYTIDGCIIVTTPQLVSINDVKKEINFCGKVDFPILGIVENMSGFNCPYCSECTNIFSSGGGETLAELLNLRFLGKVPIDPEFNEMLENQNNQEYKEKFALKNTVTNVDLIEMYKKSNLFSQFHAIVGKLLERG